MARVIPIDIIKGISGKYGKDADFYFATNTSSGKIRISQLPKPIHRPPTEKQKAQRSKFAARHAAVTAWLNANKPSELNGPKGTKAYQDVHRLKRRLKLSLINQVLLKYMDGNNVIRLPGTKEQRICKPHNPQKPWKRISFRNTVTFHRVKTGNCPNPNLKLDLAIIYFKTHNEGYKLKDPAGMNRAVERFKGGWKCFMVFECFGKKKDKKTPADSVGSSREMSVKISVISGRKNNVYRLFRHQIIGVLSNHKFFISRVDHHCDL